MSNNNIKKEKPLVITYLTNLNFYFFQWQFNQILSTQGEPVGRKGRIESRRRRRGKGERWRRRRVERVSILASQFGIGKAFAEDLGHG